MRFAVALLLATFLAWPAAGQTHVYVCEGTPTTIQGAPSNACPQERYLLPAAVQPTHWLAACSDTATNCDWSGASWRRVDATAGSALAWMTSGPGEISSRFARKDTLLGAPSPLPPPPPPVWSDGTVDLSWALPTQNEDGSPLTDLASTRIYQGGGPWSLVATVPVPVTTYSLAGLSAGTYVFAATAVNTGGVESAYSATATKTITAPDPEPEPEPPPVTDPCVLNPFTFRVRSWPGAPTGDRALGYSTNKPLASLAYTQTATRVTGIRAIDVDGCVVAVSR